MADLNWKKHPAGLGGERAKVVFDNGYYASILRGGPFYTSDGTYEVAVMDKNGPTYETPVTDDVLGYLSLDEMHTALNDIKALPQWVA